MMLLKPFTIILGSTGSVGLQAVDVINSHNATHPEKKVKILALINHSDAERQKKLQSQTGADITLSTFGDIKALEQMLESLCDKYDPLSINALNAISGFWGLKASWLLAKYRIDTLLANKESVVAGGNVYLKYAREQGINIIPVDSEHSAIKTLIDAHKNFKKILITASGGPFRDRDDLENITPKEAANHPNWKMGIKISIDSATLANKVLEVIEAKYLFSLKKDEIEVIINPQSIVHSMLVAHNNAIYAELSVPDMKLPISKAYGFVDQNFIAQEDFSSLRLDFSKPDKKHFKFLNLIASLLSSHRNCIIFNAADEVAVDMFKAGVIKFNQIYDVVKFAIERADEISNNKEIKSLDEIYSLDEKCRKFLYSSKSIFSSDA